MSPLFMRIFKCGRKKTSNSAMKPSLMRSVKGMGDRDVAPPQRGEVHHELEPGGTSHPAPGAHTPQHITEYFIRQTPSASSSSVEHFTYKDKLLNQRVRPGSGVYNTENCHFWVTYKIISPKTAEVSNLNFLEKQN